MPRIFSEAKIILPRDTAQKKSRGASGVGSHVHSNYVTSTNSEMLPFACISEGNGHRSCTPPISIHYANKRN
jgi:hypothetical protein